MRLEVRFFSAVPGSPVQPCVGILVVDFDETLTESDTTPSIIATAIAAAESHAFGARLQSVPQVVSALLENTGHGLVAGELKARVREEREAQRDQLVANYARERDVSLADILPRVRLPLQLPTWLFTALPCCCPAAKHTIIRALPCCCPAAGHTKLRQLELVSVRTRMHGIRMSNGLKARCTPSASQGCLRATAQLSTPDVFLLIQSSLSNLESESS